MTIKEEKNLLQYHLYVIQKIKQGLEDIKKGRTFTQAQVEKRMAARISLG